MSKKDTTNVVSAIKNIAKGVHSEISKKKAPSLNMPVRALQNVKYDSKTGFFELLGKMKERTLSASTVKTFAQSLLMMNESKKIVETDEHHRFYVIHHRV
jgi:DNA topoisomerase VI subunit A